MLISIYEKLHNFNILKDFLEIPGSALHAENPNVRLDIHEKRDAYKPPGGKV